MSLNELTFKECYCTNGPKRLDQKNAIMLLHQPPAFSMNECPLPKEQVLVLQMIWMNLRSLRGKVQYPSLENDIVPDVTGSLLAFVNLYTVDISRYPI
jgi:hypothetical protein